MPRYTIDTGQLDTTEAAMVQALAHLADAESDESREQAREDLGHALLGAEHWESALWADMQEFYRELLASNDAYPRVCDEMDDRWRDSPYGGEWSWATDRLREWTQNPDTARDATTRAHRTGRWTPPKDGYEEESDDLPDMRHLILDMALLIADPSVRQVDSDDAGEFTEPFDMWSQVEFGADFVVNGVEYDGTVWSPDGDSDVVLLTERIDRQLREKFVSAAATESGLKGQRFSAAFRMPGTGFDDVVVEVNCYVHFGWTAVLHRVLFTDDTGPWFGLDVRDEFDCLLPSWARSSTTKTADELVDLLATGERIHIDYPISNRDDADQVQRPRWDTPIPTPPDVVTAMRQFEQRMQQLRQADNDARTPQRLEADRAALQAELQHRAEQPHTRSAGERRLAELIAERGHVLLDELNRQIADRTTQRWFTPSTDADIDIDSI